MPYNIAIKFAVECLADTCDNCDTTNMSALNFFDRQHMSGTHDAGIFLVVKMVPPANLRTQYMTAIAVDTAPNDTNRNNLVHHFQIGTADVMRTHTN